MHRKFLIYRFYRVMYKKTGIVKKQLVKLKEEHGQMEKMIQLMQNMIDELEQQQ